MNPTLLRIASCMAPNADDTCRAITRYLQRKLGIATTFVDDISWRERERQFDAGEIQLCWLCGLPYVRKADKPAPEIELLATSVMAAARYGGQPVYFSDVVVRQHSRFGSFNDLRGATWAYNEPDSHSGYNVVRHHLRRLGKTAGFFGGIVESGAHQTSLKLLIDGDIDASAIDSTVLEAECARAPRLRSAIRVIDTLGPSPMPPWVMRKNLPVALKQSLRAVFLGMGDDAEGRDILSTWGMARFVAINDATYDPIRVMAADASYVRLSAKS
jgi:phosphonate transport system substrate-binding protein